MDNTTTTENTINPTGKKVILTSKVDINLENKWQSLHGEIGDTKVNSPSIMFSTGANGTKLVRTRDSKGIESDFMSAADAIMIGLAFEGIRDDLVDSVPGS